MREHRIYHGFLQNDHYFVEVKKDLFDEWPARKVRNITHKDIVQWRLRERERKAKVMLMTFRYFKQGCGDTVKLIRTVKSGFEERAYQELKDKRYNY